MNGQAKIQVRPAQPEEIPIVVGFVERMLCEQNRKTLDLDRAQMIQACQDILANDQQRIYLAFDGKRPVGMAGVVQSTSINTAGPFGVINELYVEPEYRSCGVGKALLDDISEYGAAQGWSCIEVGTPGGAYFSPAVDFYLREGFTEIGPRLKLPLSD